jgi:long-chain fatty acid transport protein
MKITKKFFSTAIVCCLCANSLFAGGILTNTNQSAHFLRNPARGASMEIDAVYTNPAGLAKLSHNGFHFTLNNQSAFQTRTITSTFAPFAMNGGSATKEFKGNASALAVPSFMVAYKTGNWVVSGSFAIVGGGGSLIFDNGLPSFEMPISMLPLQINSAPLPFEPKVTQYSADMYMKGSSIIYGAQLGATYAINDIFSVFAGGRMAFVNNSHEGYLRNIQINPTVPELNPNGNMMSAPDFFNAIGQTGQAAAVADQELVNKQSGAGFTPILGFNFNWERLNAGVKYEFRTALSVTNKTEIDVQNMFPDGTKVPHDIPALLTIGAQYDILPCVTISGGFHQFFDSKAKMANDKQKYINGGNTEYLLGTEWRINPKFLVSAGGQITRTGVTDNYQTDLSYSLNSYSIGFGGAVNVTEKIRINAGYFFTVFEDWKDKRVFDGGTPPMNVYSRTNQAFGIGVDFRF